MERRNKIAVGVALATLTLVFLKGCDSPLTWRMSFDDAKVEKISKYHKGDRFALRQDVFVVRSSAYSLGLLAVGLPRRFRRSKGQGSYYSVPESVEEWQARSGEKEEGNDEFLDLEYGMGPRIVGVMPQGTELEVVGRKVVYGFSWWGGFEKSVYVMASCALDGKRIELEMSDLTNWRTKAPFEEFLSRIPASGFEGHMERK